MNNGINLTALLSQTSDPRQRLASFAFLCLGAIESLASATVRAEDAIRLFFHADNCLFVRRELQVPEADELMSRGVQLADLFDVLGMDVAQEEYRRELAAMHSLCLKLLEERDVAA